MSIIDQFKAEVERLKKDVDKTPLATEQIAGYLFALVDVQKFISTLKEQPVCEGFDGLTPEEKMNHPLYLEGFEVGRKVGLVLAEKTTIPAEGLEEEIDKRYLQTRVLGYIDGVGEILLGREAFGRIARYFAQWQKEQMISALKNDGDLPIEFIDKFHEIDCTAFQNGQANMKEQMLKGAVEGMIDYVYDEKGDAYKAIRLDWIVGDFGDKVRIIIVKED